MVVVEGSIPEQQHEKIPRKLAIDSGEPHSGRGMWKYMVGAGIGCCFEV